jgi:hypothetical protein
VALVAAGCLDGLSGGDDSSVSPHADTLVSEESVFFVSCVVWEAGQTGDDGDIGGGTTGTARTAVRGRLTVHAPEGDFGDTGRR